MGVSVGVPVWMGVSVGVPVWMWVDVAVGVLGACVCLVCLCRSLCVYVCWGILEHM